MVYTSRIRGNVDRRPQAFWGALIPAAINLVGGIITTAQQAKAQKKAIEAQKEFAQQQLNVSNQNNLAATLNNYASAQDSYSDEDYNLKYRNGGTRRLGSNGIVITDGGNAKRIGNNTFLLRGGSHEDINETGQTGIGINVGGNEIEAEGGEVAQKKGNSLRIFSAQPMLSGGISPAQAVVDGANKDKVFVAQQRFKRNNHLNDNGKYSLGGNIKRLWNVIRTNRSPIDNIAALAIAYNALNPYSQYNKQKGKFNGGKFNGAGAGNSWTNDYKSKKGFDNFNDAFDAARAAGRTNFIYRAGKYNNYSTAKEEDTKKEALNRRYGARRIAKRFGGLEHPRRRYEDGGSALPELDITAKNKRKFNEWNNYLRNSVLRQGTPTVPYQNSAYTPKVQSYIDLINTPYNGRQSSFKPATQDYIGLGIDTLAALGSGIFARNAYNKLNFDYNLPSYVDETPVAFDTTYHNEAQRANIERNRINDRNLIQGNTASAQASLARMQQVDTNAMLELNKLADEKANKEVELRNQNAANEQQVRARNATARNQYYQNVAQIQNAALEARNNAALAKAQSIGADLSGLSQAWSNFAESTENRYNANQNQIAIMAQASNPSVVKNAITMGYDLSPQVLANLYRSTNNEELKKAILGRISYRDRNRYGLN